MENSMASEGLALGIRCDSAHRYWLRDPGSEQGEREVPGVTSILQAAGLIDMQWVTQFGLDRGTAIHSAVHYDNAGDLDEASLDPAVKPYLEQWCRFKKMTGIKVINGEQIVYSKIHDYAGTYDILVEFFGQPVLLDFKTNKKPAHVWQQLGMYSFALREAGVRLNRVACLELLTDDFRLTTWEPLQAEAEAMRVLAQVKEMPQ